MVDEGVKKKRKKGAHSSSWESISRVTEHHLTQCCLPAHLNLSQAGQHMI